MAAVVTHPLDLGTTPSLLQLSCVTDHCGSEGTTTNPNSRSAQNDDIDFRLYNTK